MRDISEDSQSLTAFRKQPWLFTKLMKKTNRPLVLTVRGKPELVVQTPESYQRLLDIAAGQSAYEGIRQGLEDVRKGRTRPAKAVFAAFEAKRGLSS